MASAIRTESLALPALGAPVAPSWPRLATEVLDLLREAVLVLGRDARLLGSNRHADELLAERDGLALLRGGVVASTPDATRALWYSVERAAYGAAGRLRVPRSGRSSLLLRVEPHRGPAAGPAAAVVFASDGEPPVVSESELATRHGLTPTECRVAKLLCAGAGLPSVARALDISPHTVRGHLKQIFGKTGTHRQAELVARLLSVG
jgi:DNA-binding CsgD family transcriptional regulator